MKFQTSWNWLVKNKIKFTKITKVYKIPKFTILIPVLREQSIIHKTLERFSMLKNVERIIFITTEKENINKGNYSETTKQILEREKGKYKNIEITHYPETFGVMSHQLNYACKILNSKPEDKDSFILVYNADSEIFQDTIDHFQKYLIQNPNSNIIQQSAVFIGYFSKYKNTFIGEILRAVALYQSRWTFSHEVYRLINQIKSKKEFLKECGHVVGHGLCIRLSTLEKVGYFPSGVPNEDMPLGFFLRLLGEKIHLLPILEIAESPRQIKFVISQYITWFYGVIYYPVYAGMAIKKYPNKKLQTFFWAILNTARALTWLLVTYVWLFLFLYSSKINLTMFIFVIFVFMVYSVVNNFIVYRKLKLLFPNYFQIKYNPILLLKFILAAMIVYIFQSIPPTIAVKNILVSKIFRKNLNKNKTER
ncbi:MAG: glycosyltransferase family 2 protein [Patescibacteria group bacterium]